MSFAAARKSFSPPAAPADMSFPAALAKALIARGAEVVLADARGGVYQGVPTGVEIHRIRSKGFAGKGFLGRLTSIPQLGVGVLQTRALLGRIKPRLAVGFGGLCLPAAAGRGELARDSDGRSRTKTPSWAGQPIALRKSQGHRDLFRQDRYDPGRLGKSGPPCRHAGSGLRSVGSERQHPDYRRGPFVF